MSTVPAFIVHDGKLETTEDLKHTLGLNEGAKLFIVSANDEQIVLRREDHGCSAHIDSPAAVMAAWNSFCGILPDRANKEWLAVAMENKRLATKHLEDLYASKTADITEIMQAEKAWELADDELDFGPFSK